MKLKTIIEQNTNAHMRALKLGIHQKEVMDFAIHTYANNSKLCTMYIVFSFVSLWYQFLLNGFIAFYIVKLVFVLKLLLLFSITDT